MKISLIAAMDLSRGIGRGGRLPWDLPDDLRHFRRLTLDKHVIMGATTYDGIGSLLPRRHMLVLSRRDDYAPLGSDIAPTPTRSVRRVGSVDEALEAARAAGAEEVFVAGGGQVYEETLLLCQRVYLTLVLEASTGADTFFPHVFQRAFWRATEHVFHAADEGHALPFVTMTLDKVEKPWP